MRSPGRIRQDLRALMRRLEQARARGRQIGRKAAAAPEPDRSRIGAKPEPDTGYPRPYGNLHPGDKA